MPPECSTRDGPYENENCGYDERARFCPAQSHRGVSKAFAAMQDEWCGFFVLIGERCIWGTKKAAIVTAFLFICT
jgi:hypothetical protein